MLVSSFCCTIKWVSYLYTYLSSLADFHPIQVTTDHWVEFSKLYNRFSLAVCFIPHISSVYVSIPVSQLIPTPLPPLVSICLLSRSVNSPIPFSHIYALIYDVCISLSDLLHPECQSPGPSISMQMVQLHSLYGRVIFHCIYVPHFLYPSLYWWTFKLLPCPGYCK